MVRVIKSRGSPVKCGVIKVPFRGSILPDEFVKIMPVYLIAGPAMFCSKIILIPPSPFHFRREWLFIAFQVVDQVSTYRNERPAAFRPKRRDDAGRTRSPFKTAQNGFFYF